MKTATYVFAALFILGGLFCLFIMYESAGGMHGYAEFRWTRVWANRNGSLTYFYGGFGFLAAGIVILIQRLRRSSRKRQSSDQGPTA